MARVLRHDRGELAKPVRTPQGLRVEGYASRAGVYRYVNADGSTRLELRPDSEAFSADALAGYEAAPITNGHPGAAGDPLVSHDSALRAKHARGVVLAARQDEDKVAVTGTITDPQTVSDIEAGRRELSPGYMVDIDETPGVDPKYGRYDAVQRNIRIDHLALVDRARGGHAMQLRLDGEMRMDDPEDGDGPGAKSEPNASDCYYGAEHDDAVENCDGSCNMQPRGDERYDAELTAAARNALHPQKFAVPGKRKLPIQDAGHVKAAMSYVGKTEGLTSEEKSEAVTRIANAADKLGVSDEGFKATHHLDGSNMTTKATTPAPAPAVVPAVPPTAEALRIRCDEQDATITSINVQLTKAKAELKDLEDVSVKLRAAVERGDAAELALHNERAALEPRIRKAAELRTKAVMLLGGKCRLDGLADDDVAKAVLQALTPDEPFASKSPEWRRVRVDELVSSTDAVRIERGKIADAVRADGLAAAPKKTSLADLWKAGPPQTTLARKGK